jgi:hypothetical protein
MSDSEAPDVSPPRALAEITDYAQMVAAFRARAQQRHIAITNPAVAEVAGLRPLHREAFGSDPGQKNRHD